MMLMVTSSFHQHMVHPRASGLGPKLLGLRFQFRGDLSTQIASFTSESDSNTLAGYLRSY
jgi:hypothetical protein